MNNYTLLLQKLDEFTRKYYKNELIKGIIYSVALLLGSFLLVVLLEYFGRFSPAVRTVFFFALAIISVAVVARWFVLPLAKIYRLGKIISHEEASKIIGKHFNEVADKLLNTLQLKSQSNAAAGLEQELIEAAIQQRLLELKPVPFSSAIDLSNNKRYLKYALPPLAAFILILIISPKILTESTERLVNFDREFVPEAPFQFELLNRSLNAVQQESFALSVAVNGAVLPNEAFIEIDGNLFKLEKDNKNKFNYLFNNVQENETFRFYADGFYSKSYELEVLAKPVLSNFMISVDYPKYLNRPSEEFNNQGDFTVPQGSVVKWIFNTKNTDQLQFIADSIYYPKASNDNQFKVTRRLMSNLSYALTTANTKVAPKDTLKFSVSVLADQFPEITVEEKKDSISAKLFYFSGKVKDDYGFSKLTFNYKKSSGENAGPFLRKELKVSASTAVDEFFHVWNLAEIDIKPGEELSYYFEVSDNDGVNGAKSSKSSIKTLKIPSADELEKQQKEASENIKSSLSENIKEAQKLQKELQQLQRNLLNDKNLDWKEKKQIRDLLDKQKQLEKNVNELKEENKIKNFQQNEFDQQQNEEILQKQEQLEKLFEELMSEDMKNLYKQLEELMNKVDKDKIMEKLQEMQQKNQDVEKELDRTLELFKQMEFEQKMTQNIDKLKDLAKEQQKLANETKDGKQDQNKLEEKQNKLNEDFKKLGDELKELEQKAKELENEMSPEKTKEKQEQIKNDQQNASEQLQKKQNSKAAQEQQKAGEKMEEMADQLDQMMQEQEQKQQGEDMESLRQLLDNLIKLSFDQERVMQNLKVTPAGDPKYVTYTQLQKKYKDDAKIIKDSLFALSKRVAQLQSVVNKEISSINRNMDKSIALLADRQTGQANASQQFVMTSLNNLALILDESLKQMQEQMKNAKAGKGSCSKPGQGKPSAGNLSKMQEQMAKKLEQMRKEMEKGEQPGGKKPEGKKPGGQQGQGGMSEGLAKMAAQQAAIRRELERASQELNKEGKGAGNGLKEIAKQMEEIEKDLVNKRIKPETIRRQQEIMTRLLEHEKAQKEREFDNKRESNQPKEYPMSNPQSYFDYQKKKQNEIELLKTVPVGLKPYYKTKTEKYFNSIKGS